MSFLAREYHFYESELAAAKDQRTMAMRSVKKLLRPLMRMIKKKQLLQKTLAEVKQQNDYNSSLEDMRKDPAALHAYDDNLANEALEQRLHEQLQHCAPEAAIIVRQGDSQQIVPVKQQHYIPVHFARTANGTFFWTSTDMQRQQELQLRQQLDRWGQA
ncbi:enhancer of split malpha protein-like [Rhagoletis pomonella]|uniref:enhancer of split malpha protein-like n=1 Tax=Rhagoletis pomonella TaxID=28610 RepID=UPI001785230E|nr:enhancer of split malpha protein-like [Rhagoletis pomonella]